jgi:hypothetical protein
MAFSETAASEHISHYARMIIPGTIDKCPIAWYYPIVHQVARDTPLALTRIRAAVSTAHLGDLRLFWKVATDGG